MDISDRDRVVDCPQSKLVGLTRRRSTLHVTARHPHHQAIRIVIATWLVGHAAILERCTSHFGCPDDQCLFQQAPLFKVCQQARDRLIHFSRVSRHATSHVAMIIPAVRTNLHPVNQQRVAHATFCQSASQQALAPKAGGDRIIQSIQSFCLFCLGREVDKFRRFRLHPKGKFISSDPRFQFTIRGTIFKVFSVQRLEQVQFLSLLLTRQSARPGQIQDRCTLAAQQRPLVGGRQVAIAPDSGTIHRSTTRVLDHRVGGHVLVLRSQPIADPGTDRWMARKLAAGCHRKGRGAVILIVCLDPVNKGQVVDVLCEMWIQFRHETPGFTMLFEAILAADTDVGKRQPTLQLTRYVRDMWQRFAMQLVQLGLVLKRLNLADPSLHEQEDAAFSLARQMLLPGSQRIDRQTHLGCQLVRHQGTQRHRPDAVVDATEKLTSRIHVCCCPIHDSFPSPRKEIRWCYRAHGRCQPSLSCGHPGR